MRPPADIWDGRRRASTADFRYNCRAHVEGGKFAFTTFLPGHYSTTPGRAGAVDSPLKRAASMGQRQARGAAAAAKLPALELMMHLGQAQRERHISPWDTPSKAAAPR